MTQEDIERVAAAQGYKIHFHEQLSRRGDGTSSIHVQAWKERRHRRSLGTLKEIAQLGEEELRQRIAAKFPVEGEGHAVQAAR